MLSYVCSTNPHESEERIPNCEYDPAQGEESSEGGCAGFGQGVLCSALKAFKNKAFKKIFNVKIVFEGVVFYFYKKCREESGYEYDSKKYGVNFWNNGSTCWLC